MNSTKNVSTPGALIVTRLRRYNHVLSEDSKLHVWARQEAQSRPDRRGQVPVEAWRSDVSLDHLGSPGEVVM